MQPVLHRMFIFVTSRFKTSEGQKSLIDFKLKKSLNINTYVSHVYTKL